MRMIRTVNCRLSSSTTFFHIISYTHHFQKVIVGGGGGGVFILSTAFGWIIYHSKKTGVGYDKNENWS
jgi:hypothetical protein